MAGAGGLSAARLFAGSPITRQISPKSEVRAAARQEGGCGVRTDVLGNHHSEVDVG